MLFEPEHYLKTGYEDVGYKSPELSSSLEYPDYIQEEVEVSVKEIQKQREEMQVEGGFRKFMFWATPILLFAQSIVMTLLLLR